MVMTMSMAAIKAKPPSIDAHQGVRREPPPA
jgi:hypothetical protein